MCLCDAVVPYHSLFSLSRSGCLDSIFSLRKPIEMSFVISLQRLLTFASFATLPSSSRMPPSRPTSTQTARSFLPSQPLLRLNSYLWQTNSSTVSFHTPSVFRGSGDASLRVRSCCRGPGTCPSGRLVARYWRPHWHFNRQHAAAATFSIGSICFCSLHHIVTNGGII